MAYFGTFIRIINNSSINWTLYDNPISQGLWVAQPPACLEARSDTQGEGGDPDTFTISAKKGWGYRGCVGCFTYTSSLGSSFTLNFANTCRFYANSGNINKIIQDTGQNFSLIWNGGAGTIENNTWTTYRPHHIPKKGNALFMFVEIHDA